MRSEAKRSKNHIALFRTILRTFFSISMISSSSGDAPIITSGSGEATKSGRKAAIKQYNEYVKFSNANYGTSLKEFELETKQKFLNMRSWQQFGYYLVNHSQKLTGIIDTNANGDEEVTELAWRSVLQYHSGVVNAVLRKEDDANLSQTETQFLQLLGNKDETMTELRCEMRNQLIRRCIINGQAVHVKAFKTSFSTLIQGCLALHSRGM